MNMYNKCPGCLKSKTGNIVKTRTGILEFCVNCKSLWREEGAAFSEYGKKYFETRGHEGSRSTIRNSKIATFSYFYRKALLPPKSKVLEIGCATGWGLVAGQSFGYEMRGLDVAAESRQYAIDRGFSPSTVVQSLDELSGEKFDLVAFFDALEHIPEPEKFLMKLLDYLKPNAQLLVVIPRSDTVSRKILGSLWPHYLADHWVHFSREGLKALMKRSGFVAKHYFLPYKWITPFTMARHLYLHSGIDLPIPSWPMFPFNFGEDGAVFQLKQN